MGQTDDTPTEGDIRIDPEWSREEIIGAFYDAFGWPDDGGEGDMTECDMCGKPNGAVLRPDGQTMCSECWTVWND